jgi:hypothetical protein
VLRAFEARADDRERPDHSVAEFRQHIFQDERNQCLVFDDKNAQISVLMESILTNHCTLFRICFNGTAHEDRQIDATAAPRVRRADGFISFSTYDRGAGAKYAQKPKDKEDDQDEPDHAS